MHLRLAGLPPGRAEAGHVPDLARAPFLGLSDALSGLAQEVQVRQKIQHGLQTNRPRRCSNGPLATCSPQTTFVMSARSFFAGSWRFPDMDPDTLELRPNPAQEAFNKNEAQRAVYRARKNAERAARERIRPDKTPSSGGARA
jgi:hypothetical protein